MKLKHKQFGFKADSVGEDGTFTGYGSVFGNVDSYGEVVAPGAFTESLKAIKKSGDPLPMLWQHRSDSPIGGFDTLAEDDRGLKLTGSLLIGSIPLADQAYALMKARIVKGLSIGYYEDEISINKETGIVTLTKLDLVEVSVVTFPANQEAQIDAVKSISAAMRKRGTLPSIKEFESFLREAGFSKTEAAALACRSLGKSGGSESRDDNGVLAILESFKL